MQKCEKKEDKRKRMTELRERRRDEDKRGEDRESRNTSQHLW